MADLRERLEIRIEPERLKMLKREAERRKVSVAEIVREAIDNWYSTTREEKLKAARELFEVEAPVGDWERMKKEIEEGYAL